MNKSSEFFYIKKCIAYIEENSPWKESDDWRNRDYQYLSEAIFEKTKTNISVSTLKRIWNISPDKTPQVSTLNALASFIDFNDWNDFKGSTQSERISVAVKTKSKSGKRYLKRVLVFGVIFLALGTIVVASVFMRSGRDKFREKPTAENVVFTSRKTVSTGLPNSVVFKYDIERVNYDSAFIQQDWDNRRRTRVFENDKFHTSIYYYPGHFNAKLVLNNTIIKEHPLYIKTNGWMGIYTKQFHQEIPIYLNNLSLSNATMLHISVDDLKKNKIENDKDYYTAFYNYRNFGEVFCDSFKFESVVRNTPEEGGLPCSFVRVSLEAENGMMSAIFCEPGCTSQAELWFARQYKHGRNNDLSAFGMDLSEWQKITYLVENKQVSFLKNDSVFYTFRFKKDIGKIVGISYWFYGNGSVKESKLYDAKGIQVFDGI